MAQPYWYEEGSVQGRGKRTNDFNAVIAVIPVALPRQRRFFYCFCTAFWLEFLNSLAIASSLRLIPRISLVHSMDNMAKVKIKNVDIGDVKPAVINGTVPIILARA
jgi:hypothetical protein